MAFRYLQRYCALLVCCVIAITGKPFAQTGVKNIYHDGWIDLNKNGIKDIYEDPTQDIDERVNDLISQMTLEEKTCQMVTLYGYGRVCKDELPTPEWKNMLWKDGIGNIDEHLNNLAYHKTAETKLAWPPSEHVKAINQVQKFFVEETRLGIPAEFTNEGIRGLCHEKCTSFPSQLGIGASFNTSLAYHMGRITGAEAKTLRYNNVYSPILDVARDPRWGRQVECYGEDPFLVSTLGYQTIIGLQEQGIVSTPKHFAIYGAPKGGRDGEARTDPHITERELHSIYLVPFAKAVKEGKVKGLMSSYNDYNGVPVSSSDYFLTELLRNQWGFKGYIVSDSRAVEFICDKHHVAADRKDAVYQSVKAGLNVRTDFTMPEDFAMPLRELVREGTLSMDIVDLRVKDILRVKFEEGLFDEPFGKQFDEADKLIANSEFLKVAYQASLESIVLLKNENNILPLDFSKYRSVLVTGPNAMAINHSISRYGPSHIDVVSVLRGIQEKFPKDVKINYSKGCDFFDKNWPENEIIPMAPTPEEQSEIDRAVKMAKKNDLIIAVVGDDEETVGESRSRTSLDLPGNQNKLLEALYTTGKPMVVVLINGRAMTINWINKFVPAVIDGWFQGQFGGSAIADVLVGNYNPGGKLPISFPKSVGQLPMNFPNKPGAQANQPIGGANGAGNTRVNGFLYPFGYGLSYTTFEYKNLKIDQATLKNNQVARITAQITNTGKRKGDEVVQLYFADCVSTVTVYEKQLRGFARVSLEPDETKTVSFELSRDDLSLYNRAMEFVLEPGEFEIMVGSSSEDIRLTQKIQVN